MNINVTNADIKRGERRDRQGSSVWLGGQTEVVNFFLSLLLLAQIRAITKNQKMSYFYDYDYFSPLLFSDRLSQAKSVLWPNRPRSHVAAAST